MEFIIVVLPEPQGPYMLRVNGNRDSVFVNSATPAENESNPNLSSSNFVKDRSSPDIEHPNTWRIGKPKRSQHEHGQKDYSIQTINLFGVIDGKYLIAAHGNISQKNALE
jgi:hypothetical protein